MQRPFPPTNEWILGIPATLEAEGAHVTARFPFAHNNNRGNGLSGRVRARRGATRCHSAEARNRPFQKKKHTPAPPPGAARKSAGAGTCGSGWIPALQIVAGLAAVALMVGQLAVDAVAPLL